MEIALSMEAAQKSAHTLYSAETPQLLKVDDQRWKTTKKPTKAEEEKPCYRCGKTGMAPAVVGLEKPNVFIVGNWGMSQWSVRAGKSNQEARLT